ncbi:acyl-CoA synthetase family member 2, mitochondrial [Cimex lectularius]|uniref:Medium-chain acyl-CoA ligase ACSF2, mitochondrial n=1 Tax=Cimex lectularius TaxID=79782 RepID=A0A8I6RMK9_CIMLE|nr:acyl-CoA synthetase family member 2, mitochondrial [Cimex lectularius]
MNAVIRSRRPERIRFTARLDEAMVKQIRSSFTAIVTFTRRCFSSLSYYHYEGSEPLRPLTIGQLLDNAAEKWPDRIAVSSKHENVTLTYSQLRDKANQLAASFLKLGLKPGDRIGALGTNSINWFLTLHAAAKAGLILAGINPLYRPNELKYTFNKAGLRAVVTDVSFKSQNFYKMLSEISPSIAQTPPACQLKTAQLPELEFLIVNSDEQLPGTYRFKDVEGLADNLDQFYQVSRNIQPDEAGNIQYTSGTTGYPKAATLTHFGMVNNAHFFGKRCGLHEQHHIVCLQVPLFHVFGSVLGVVTATDFGSTLIFPGPHFSANYTIQTLKTERCTAIYGTPTMYTDVCRSIKEMLEGSADLQKGLKNFSVAVSGGALCTPQLFKDISYCFNTKNIQSAYGMSEMSPITFTNTYNDTFEQRTETVGKVAEHTEVKVVDSNGKMVPFGTPGEVWFRSYSLMLGYWRDEEKTKENITPCRWMKSGDLMILTENGYGRVVGRIKDIIIKSGENIVPLEIEQYLQKHPKILEAQVYGCYDERLGEDVCASIQLHRGSTMTVQEVKDFCKDKIAKYKIPTHIRFVDNFPKTASGKIKKNELKDMINKELSEKKVRR